MKRMFCEHEILWEYSSEFIIIHIDSVCKRGSRELFSFFPISQLRASIYKSVPADLV